VIHHQSLHWKVSGIAGRETGSYTYGGSCNKTVGLAENRAATGKLAPPPAGLFPLNPSEGSKPQAVQKPRDAGLLARLHSSKELFHVDGAGVRTIASGAQLTDPGRRRSAA
jgi:hypothetical protein